MKKLWYVKIRVWSGSTMKETLSKSENKLLSISAVLRFYVARDLWWRWSGATGIQLFSGWLSFWTHFRYFKQHNYIYLGIQFIYRTLFEPLLIAVNVRKHYSTAEALIAPQFGFVLFWYKLIPTSSSVNNDRYDSRLVEASKTVTIKTWTFGSD